MISLCVFLVLLAPQWAEAAEKIIVGVAPSYIQPFRELAADFEKKTAVAVIPTFAATGHIYSQIRSGAPYDIFLAADEDRPEKLFREGLAEKPFVYATGHLAMWSARKDSCKRKSWQEDLKSRMTKKITIPNLNTSPYGSAAYFVLSRSGIWEFIKPQVVFAQDVSQSFQYAATGAADIAFVPLSYAVSANGSKGCYYPVMEAAPVRQAACVLKKNRNRKAIEAFADYLLSHKAAEVRKKHGYD